MVLLLGQVETQHLAALLPMVAAVVQQLAQILLRAMEDLAVVATDKQLTLRQ
jgi:hypothetical protein